MLRHACRIWRPRRNYTARLPWIASEACCRLVRAHPLEIHEPGRHAVQCGALRALKACGEAGATLEHRPDEGSCRQDDYTRWYLQDADRVVHAETYERGYHHSRRIRVVCALLRRAGVRQVLDLGCGDGCQVGRLIRAG